MIHEIKVPQVGESINEVTIGQWLKKEGEWVNADEVVCEIESEKATLEIPSENAGVLHILIPEGETVAVGATIARIDSDAKEEASPAGAPEVEAQKSEPSGSPAQEEAVEVSTEKPVGDRQVKISPVAARLLQEAGIPESTVAGSGAGGRITKQDALKAIETAKAEKPREKTAQPEKETPTPSPQKETIQPTDAPQAAVQRVSGGRTERRVKMSTLRKTIARRLVAAKNETAMLTTFNEVDMTAIMETRARYRDRFQEKYQVKLGFMSFFVKACATALLEFPEVNAAVDGDEIVYHDYCDISIAVSTPRGLVVPVIFNAHRMSLAEIEAEVARLAEKARQNKLTIEEMSGGTFSITNGGVFGSLLSTPIINAPQSAILGMHKIQERPVALNGEVVIRPMMYVSLSYDHRLIDGKESVSFLVRVKELLEDPLRLLLEI